MNFDGIDHLELYVKHLDAATELFCSGFGFHVEDLEALRAHGVLADREGEGYLLQVFTRSAHPRGTLFFELIQRKRARGFGGANVRALYQAVEQEMLRKEHEARTPGERLG